MVYLWLDDIRNPNNNMFYARIVQNIGDVDNFQIVWVKSYYQFVDYLKEYGVPDFIDFDHDLGLNPDGQELNGYDCCKYLIQYCIDNNVPAPNYSVHSSNPVGTDNIISLYKAYQRIYKNF